MDATIDSAREAAEALSDGLNCLYSISIASDFSDSASLSRMRDGLSLIRAGVVIQTNMIVDDSMIAKLDKIIELLGGIDDSSLENARNMARSYLAELVATWGIPLPEVDSAKE